MIRRPTCAGRLNATEPKFSQIEGCNEGVDHANRIVICNPVVQAFRQQSRLPAISSLNETSHASPRRFSAGIIAGTAFSHSQGHETPIKFSGVLPLWHVEPTFMSTAPQPTLSKKLW